MQNGFLIANPAGLTRDSVLFCRASFLNISDTRSCFDFSYDKHYVSRTLNQSVMTTKNDVETNLGNNFFDHTFVNTDDFQDFRGLRHQSQIAHYIYHGRK